MTRSYYSKDQQVPMDDIPSNDWNVECISCHNIAIKNKITLYPILVDDSQFVLCKTCAMTNGYIEWNAFEEICPIE